VPNTGHMGIGTNDDGVIPEAADPALAAHVLEASPYLTFLPGPMAPSGGRTRPSNG